MSSLVDPTDDLAETIGGGGGGGGEVPSAPGAVGQVTSLEIGDHIEVLDEERGWLLFRIYHLVAKSDGLHDVRAVKEDELDYLIPHAERTPRGRTADDEISFLRNSDGNLTFPEDVRPASRGAECEGECGALVWAVAFEELVPEYTLSACGLSIPGPGGTWRTEVEKKTLSDRFTYALTLVDPGGNRWRQSELKQLAERLFRNQPQQLKTALEMVPSPAKRARCDEDSRRTRPCPANVEEPAAKMEEEEKEQEEEGEEGEEGDDAASSLSDEEREAATAAIAGSGDEKPDVKEGGDAINLKVVTQDGSEIFFKCKKTTALSELMNAFCQRQGMSQQGVRFLFDGERLNGNQTPAEMDMEDDDVIDVMVEHQAELAHLKSQLEEAARRLEQATEAATAREATLRAEAEAAVQAALQRAAQEQQAAVEVARADGAAAARAEAPQAFAEHLRETEKQSLFMCSPLAKYAVFSLTAQSKSAVVWKDGEPTFTPPALQPAISELRRIVAAGGKGGRPLQGARLVRIEMMASSHLDASFQSRVEGTQHSRMDAGPTALQWNPSTGHGLRADQQAEKERVLSRLLRRCLQGSQLKLSPVCLAFHGTTPEAAEKICRQGFRHGESRSSSDWFGHGHYLTTHAEYALRYSTGQLANPPRDPVLYKEYCVLACWVAPGVVYPLTRVDYHGASSASSSSHFFPEDNMPIAIKNGNDSHYVLVSEELQFQAVNSEGETCRRDASVDYDELVVADRDQVLPKFKLFFCWTD